MRHIDPTLGQLLPHRDGKLDGVVGTSHKIWVPHKVEILPFPRYPYHPTFAELPAVAFPVPNQLPESRLARPEPLYPKPDVEPYFCPTIGFCDLCSGYETQWQRKTDTANLLNDFLNLADYDHGSEQTCKRVVIFAQQWGPLWRCRGTRHNSP